MKLKHLISHEISNVKAQMNLKKDFKVLDQFFGALFPEFPAVAKNLRFLTREDANVKNVYHDKYLPYHLNDKPWLAKYLAEVYQHLQSNQALLKNHKVTKRDAVRAIPLASFEKYVNESPMFATQRNQYEQDLVKAYAVVSKSQAGDDFYADGATKAQERESIFYDELLRKRVVGAMRTLGVNRLNVEDALEMNLDLWRDEARAISFLNTFKVNKVLASLKVNNPLLEGRTHALVELKKREKELYGKWTTLRNYHYYLNHKGTIDRLGMATEAMKMPDEAVASLRKEIDLSAYKYQNELTNCMGRYFDVIKYGDVKPEPALASVGKFETVRTK